MALTAKFIADFSSFTAAVNRAEVELRGFEGSANKVGATLNKMTNSFSGTKIIQDAHLMTAAMVHAGGITALTDKELRKLNATVTEAADKMRRMGIEVPPGFKKIQDAAETLDKSTSGLSVKMVAFGTAIGTFVGRIAYDAVRALGREMVDLATNGIKLAPVVTAFERLTASVGLSGDEMIRVTKTATKGLVTDLDIMAASNKALLLGLPVTAQSMGLMGTAAVALGKAMKQDASKSLDDLITALGRSSPMILDNLGLTVKVGEANEKYARQVGKSAESLSDAEKKLAFYNAAMDAAKIKVEQLGGVHLTLVDQVTRVKNQFTNFTDALGIAIARSPVLEAAFGTLADEMETAFGGNQVNKVQELIKWVNEIAIAAVGVGAAFVEVAKLGSQTWSVLQDGILGLLETQFRVRASLRDLIPIQQYKEEAAVLRAMADSLRDQAKEGNDQQVKLQKTLDAAASAAERMQSRMIAANSTQVKSAAIASDLTGKLGELGVASDDAAKAAKKHADAVANLVDKLGGHDAISNARAWMSALTQIGGLTRLSRTDQADLSKVLDTALAAYQRLGTQAPEAMQKLADAARLPLTSTNLLVKALATGPVSLQGALAELNDGTIPSYAALLFQATESTDAFGRVTYTQAVPALKKVAIGFEDAEQSVKKWDDSLSDLAKSFAQLAQVSGGSFEKLAKSIGTVVTVMNVAKEAGKGLKDGFKIGGVDGYSQMATSALAAVAAIDAATNSTSKYKNVLGGAAAGAAAGSKIFPVLGTAIGAAAGALVGWWKSNNMEGKTVSPLRDEFFKMAGGLEKLNPEVQKLTGNLTLVQAVFDARTVEQYNAALKELQDLFAFQAQAMVTLEDTARKYNLTIEEMGPAWQRQEMDKKAQELFKDYQVLTSAGIDHILVLGKMGTAVNEYVQNALKMGVEVPSAMRPMLQQMVDAGLLLDAQGKKFGTLEEAGISFAITMSEGFTMLIDEVKKLTDAIARGLGLAIKNIPDAEVEIRGKFIPPKDMGQNLPVFEMAKGGAGMVKKPTLFVAGEAGPEEFAFSGSNKKFAGAVGGQASVDMSGIEARLDKQIQDQRRRDRSMPRLMVMAWKDALAH